MDWSPERKGQQGSALLWMVTLLLMFLFAALVVDGTRLYHEQRRLQSMANALVTDIVNEAKTCLFTIADDASVDLDHRAVQRLSELHGAGPGGDRFHEGIRASASRIVLDSAGQAYRVRPAVSADSSNGVAVTLTRPVSGLLSFAVDEVRASATARKEVYATFFNGASALLLDSSNSPLLNALLGELFNTTVVLDGVSLASLSNVVVDLDDLLDAVVTANGNVSGGIDALLQSPVPAQVIWGVLMGVKEISDSTDLAASLQGLLDLVGVNASVKLADVIEVVGEGALDARARLPVLQLVNGIVLGASGRIGEEIRLDVGELLGLPGLGSMLDAELRVTLDHPPRIVVAPARRHNTGGGADWIGSSSAEDLSIELRLGLDLIPVGPVVVRVDVPIQISAGRSRSEYVAAGCARGNRNQVDMEFQVQRDMLSLGTPVGETISAEVRIQIIPGEIRTPMCSLASSLCAGDFHEDGSAPVLCILSSRGYCTVSTGGGLSLDLANVRLRAGHETWGSASRTGLVIREYPLAAGSVPASVSPGCHHDEDSNIIRCEVGGDGAAQLVDSLRRILTGLELERADLVGINLQPVLDTVVTTLTTVLADTLDAVVSPLASNVLQPVIGLLGLDLGTATISVLAAEQPAILLLEGCDLEKCPG